MRVDGHAPDTETMGVEEMRPVSREADHRGRSDIRLELEEELSRVEVPESDYPSNLGP